jgi:predicted nuclease of restriction endonuclease-like (RecB) superfamily
MNEITSFREIINLIENARENALRKVNEELILLYWNVGKYISEKLATSQWGDAVIDDLAKFIKDNYPVIKGFNRRGLYRMRQFYETYKDNEIVSTLLTQISWSNHLHILSKTKTTEEKEFYIKLCIKERYSARELERQIDSAYYERYMLSSKAPSPAIKEFRDKTENTFLDTYVLEFLSLPETVSEMDLRKAIIRNLKNFVLEIGKDFTFVGEEYRVQVGNKDFYIDLLFYHRGLSCLVAFELKIGDFSPEYIGKMDFYLEALDRDVKKPNENPSVGIILCTSKDDEIVEYAMSRNISPTMVAEYKLKLIDKNLLRQKLHEFHETLENRTMISDMSILRHEEDK